MAITQSRTEFAVREAIGDLRAALSKAGVVVPSLGADNASPDLGLVVLGRVRADVATKLADVIQQGTRP